MVDRIRWDTVSYLPFYYIFFEINFQFLLLTIFNLQTKILAIKDILSNLGWRHGRVLVIAVDVVEQLLCLLPINNCLLLCFDAN